jgi:hypothetical protein
MLMDPYAESGPPPVPKLHAAADSSTESHGTSTPLTSSHSSTTSMSLATALRASSTTRQCQLNRTQSRSTLDRASTM